MELSSWALKKVDKQRIATAEMRFFRKIENNKKIRTELKVIPVVKKIKEYRKKNVSYLNLCIREIVSQYR